MALDNGMPDLYTSATTVSQWEEETFIQRKTRGKRAARKENGKKTQNEKKRWQNEKEWIDSKPQEERGEKERAKRENEREKI